MHDAAFHLALLLLGGVVVAVLGEIAELTGGLDLAGDVDAPARGEVVVLGLEPVEGGLGELLCVCHADEASGLVGSLSRTAHELRRRPIESQKGAR